MRNNPENHIVKCVSDRPSIRPVGGLVDKTINSLVKQNIPLYTRRPELDGIPVVESKPSVDKYSVVKAAGEYLSAGNKPVVNLTDFVSRVVVPAPITIKSIQEVAR